MSSSQQEKQPHGVALATAGGYRDTAPLLEEQQLGQADHALAGTATVVTAAVTAVDCFLVPGIGRTLMATLLWNQDSSGAQQNLPISPSRSPTGFA